MSGYGRIRLYATALTSASIACCYDRPAFTPPEEVAEMPETVDGLCRSWVAGFDGQVYDGGRESWSEAAFGTEGLCVGDCVRVLVTYAGEFRVLVNRRCLTQAG